VAPTIDQRCIDDYYDIEDTILGQGHFSVVLLATEISTGRKYSVKGMTKAELSHLDHVFIENEVKIHRKLDDDHIVRFVDYFDDMDAYYIVMEVFGRMSLSEWLEAKEYANEEDARNIIRSVMAGLEYLHKSCIIHR
jgi:serine/threonine protein kinase